MTTDMEPLLKAAFLLLEHEEWDQARECFAAILHEDPENTQARYGLTMAELKINSRTEAPRQRRAKKRPVGLVAGLILAFLAVTVGAALLVVKFALPADRHREGGSLPAERPYEADEALPAEGPYQAVQPLEASRETRDSDERIEAAPTDSAKTAGDQQPETDPTAQAYETAMALWAQKRYGEAYALLKELDGYRDSAKYLQEYRAKMVRPQVIAGGRMYTLALRQDGTVAATNIRNAYGNDAGQANVASWSNIVAVAARWKHSVGLKADGTVVAVGDNTSGQCDVASWRDIVSVAAGYYLTAGLQEDGGIVITNARTMPSDRGYVAVAAGYSVFGLKEDGTVESDAAIFPGISAWRHVTAIAVGGAHVVGLKEDGTVAAVDAYSYYDATDYGQCKVSGWTDIVSVAAGEYHTVGLKKDGTVVAVGGNNYGQCDVSHWRDIVAIAAGFNHTIGLRSDGTLVAVGQSYHGQIYVSDWRNIRLP